MKATDKVGGRLLFASFIHTDLRIVGIVRKMVNINYVFHIGYERCAPFRRDFPVLPEVRLKFAFLSVCCTVICEMLGAKFNSTAF